MAGWRSGGRRSGEAGFTLAEILVALIILSTAVIALISAAFTLTVGADVQRKTSEVESIAVTWGESIIDESFGYQECLGPALYQVAYDNWAERYVLPDFYEAEIVDVDYWDRDINDGVNDGEFVQDCGLGYDDDGSQRFQLRVTAPDSNGSAVVTVVKNNPDATGG
ncbi:MAG: hypothetical protein EDR02_13350 [Actinobacteria bacterium]|nr:MAG: hypothetical protein EDR02_13350 [Actinomycetota bacterium]RIK02585.1 MAG: hypothetical protein DCC48_17925 [Acidobacteriota bacterium]